MTLLARASTSLRQAAARSPVATPARFAHGHGHGEYKHLPFEYKKKSFGPMVALYLISGFSIPFGAAYYQLKKSGAA